MVIPRGSLQVEVGFGWARDDRGGLLEEAIEFPSTLVRWGVASRLELRLAWAGQVDIEVRGTEAAQGLSGAGDPEIGAKFSLLSAETGSALDLALLAHASLPVGDEELGSPRVNPSIRLNGAHELGDLTGLGWNAGLETVSFEDGRGDAHTLARWIYTVALGVDLAERWGIFVELYGDLPASDPAPATHSFDAGVTFVLTPRLQLDLYGGVGLNGSAPDWIAGAGISFRIPS